MVWRVVGMGVGGSLVTGQEHGVKLNEAFLTFTANAKIII